MCYHARVKIDFQKALKRITARRGSYHADAYRYMYDIIVLLMDVDTLVPLKEITIKRFYEQMLRVAQEDYGPLAYAVFSHWGLKSNQDIARLLQHMISEGLVDLSESEQLEEIESNENLQQRLEQPFSPRQLKV